MSDSPEHGEQHGLMPVRFPAMRAEIVSALESLADRDYQERVWIRHERPTPTWEDSLDVVVHTLFDDTEVLPDPQGAVGTCVHAGEVPVLTELGTHFDRLVVELGDVPDSAYLAVPRWDDVVSRARTAWISCARTTLRHRTCRRRPTDGPQSSSVSSFLAVAQCPERRSASSSPWVDWRAR